MDPEEFSGSNEDMLNALREEAKAFEADQAEPEAFEGEEQEPQDAPEPESEPQEEEVPSWAQDLRKTQEDLNERLQILAGRQQYQPQPQAQQQYRPQPQEEEDENYLVTRQDINKFFGPMAAKIGYLEQVALQNRKQAEVNSANAALNNLMSKYPDFTEVIPVEKVQTFVNNNINSGAYGYQYEANLETAYKAFAYDRLKTKNDEVSQKREQKKAAANKAAGQVAPSGQQYQRPAEQKRDPYLRGYTPEREAFLRDLKALS